MEFIWLLVLGVWNLKDMAFPESIREKIFLMEEGINFPTSLLNHWNYCWKNFPVVPYSDLMVEVSSPVEPQIGEDMP